MKSRKLKAILAALSAVAVMATAMTGFAATKTTYDVDSKKVIVEETVTAEAGKEVTYLVKSNDQIVYIDQATANESGTATFSYKIAGDKLAADLSTTATFGTDGDTTVTGGSDVLALAKFENVDATEYTVTFTKAITGSEDTANATIDAKSGYEITDVKINGETQGVVNTVSLKIGDDLVVEAKKAYTAPTISAESTENTTDVIDGVTYNSKVTIIAATGDYKSVGVKCKGIYYPALKVENGKAAVKLILPDGSENVIIETEIETLD